MKIIVRITFVAIIRMKDCAAASATGMPAVEAPNDAGPIAIIHAIWMARNASVMMNWYLAYSICSAVWSQWSARFRQIWASLAR